VGTLAATASSWVLEKGSDLSVIGELLEFFTQNPGQTMNEDVSLVNSCSDFCSNSEGDLRADLTRDRDSLLAKTGEFRN